MLPVIYQTHQVTMNELKDETSLFYDENYLIDKKMNCDDELMFDKYRILEFFDQFEVGSFSGIVSNNNND